MRYLQPGKSQEEAERNLRRSLRRRFLIRPGKLRRVELIWVPFHLFECPFRSKEKVTTIRTIVDALVGEMASTLAAETELAEGLEPQELPAPILTDQQTQETALEHTRWLVIQGGMIGGQKGEVLGCEYVETIAYPFWVGYVEKGSRYDVRVLDAVTGESTGPKVKRVVLSALLALERRDPAKATSGKDGGAARAR